MSGAGDAPSSPRQTVVAASSRGRVVAIDSAYDVEEANRGADVVVAASYCGVLPARFLAARAPRAAIGVDCAIGKDGAGIAGLWYLEALGIPAATAAVMSVHLGEGVDVWRSGRLSRVNAPAESVGVRAGMAVAEACELVVERVLAEPAAVDRNPAARLDPELVEEWRRVGPFHRVYRASRCCSSSVRVPRPTTSARAIR